MSAEELDYIERTAHAAKDAGAPVEVPPIVLLGLIERIRRAEAQVGALCTAMNATLELLRLHAPEAHAEMRDRLMREDER